MRLIDDMNRTQLIEEAADQDSSSEVSKLFESGYSQEEIDYALGRVQLSWLSFVQIKWFLSEAKGLPFRDLNKVTSTTLRGHLNEPSGQRFLNLYSALGHDSSSWLQVT